MNSVKQEGGTGRVLRDGGEFDPSSSPEGGSLSGLNIRTVPKKENVSEYGLEIRSVQ